MAEVSPLFFSAVELSAESSNMVLTNGVRIPHLSSWLDGSCTIPASYFKRPRSLKRNGKEFGEYGLTWF